MTTSSAVSMSLTKCKENMHSASQLFLNSLSISFLSDIFHHPYIYYYNAICSKNTYYYHRKVTIFVRETKKYQFRVSDFLVFLSCIWFNQNQNMKNKFVMIAFIAMSLVACDNDEQNLLDPPKPESTVSAVMVKDGKIVSTQTRASENMGTVALKFKDEASLASFKRSLSNETDAEKQKNIMSYGVRTLHDLAEQADDELEKIGVEASVRRTVPKLV